MAKNCEKLVAAYAALAEAADSEFHVMNADAAGAMLEAEEIDVTEIRKAMKMLVDQLAHAAQGEL